MPRTYPTFRPSSIGKTQVVGLFHLRGPCLPAAQVVWRSRDGVFAWPVGCALPLQPPVAAGTRRRRGLAASARRRRRLVTPVASGSPAADGSAGGPPRGDPGSCGADRVHAGNVGDVHFSTARGTELWLRDAARSDSSGHRSGRELLGAVGGVGGVGGSQNATRGWHDARHRKCGGVEPTCGTWRLARRQSLESQNKQPRGPRLKPPIVTRVKCVNARR